MTLHGARGLSNLTGWDTILQCEVHDEGFFGLPRLRYREGHEYLFIQLSSRKARNSGPHEAVPSIAILTL